MNPGKLFMLLLLLAIGIWAWWHNQQQPRIQTYEKFISEQKLDYFIEDFSVTTMTAEGKPARILTANMMKHFRDTGISKLEQPFFSTFDQSSLVWEVESERGELSEDGETLLLSGQVRMDRSASANVRAIHISTSNLRVKLDLDYAETDDAVKITSDADWVQGIGLQAWLRRPSRIKFLSHTRAYYEAQ